MTKTKKPKNVPVINFSAHSMKKTPIWDNTEKLNQDRLASVFSEIINVMDIAVWELDLNYRVVAFNSRAKKIYGENVLGEFCYHVAGKMNTICDNCPAQKVYEGHESGRLEHQRTDGGGKSMFIDHIATPIKNKNGELIGSLIVMIDITDRKLMEEELKKHRLTLEERVALRTRELKLSEERYRHLYNQAKKAKAVYRSLIHSSADAIILYDLEGCVQYLSYVFTKLFGWTLAELKGKRIDYVPDNERKKTIAHINKVLSEGSCQGFESKRYKKNGRLVEVSISTSVYNDVKGKPCGMLTILRDISEQKRLEARLRQSQKMEAIGTLASGIAHDFNNILSIILGNCELALYSLPKSKPSYVFLDEIRVASLRAKDVVRQLLSFRGKSGESRYPLNIVPIIKESLRLLRSSIPAKVEFRQNISRKNSTILGEPTQIHQVMLNLCTNAAHAMEKNGGYLDISLENKEITQKDQRLYPDLKAGKYLKLCVSDTGHGIPPGHLERIFEPYFTTKDVGKGSGMGLSVVHGIIKNHEGIIKVRSQVDQGTVFEIFLPEIQAEEKKRFRIEHEYPTGNESILLVDDDDSILKLEKEMLTRLGYRVETYNNPLKALEQFVDTPEKFDLLITDMLMPKMNGDELIRELLKIKPDLPTILCTGYNEKVNEKNAMKLGVQALLLKPISMHTIAVAARDALKDKHRMLEPPIFV